MPVQDLFERVTKRQFHDPRTTFADLRLDTSSGAAYVRGEILDRAAAAALLDELRAHAPDVDWHDGTVPLVEGPQHAWATVNRAVVDVRRSPSNSAERITQALWGEACELLQIQNVWALVRTAGGYLGWTPTEPLHHTDEQIARTWGERCTHGVCVPFAPVFTNAACQIHEQIALLPFGVPVPVQQRSDGSSLITYPNGKKRWIKSEHLLPLSDVPQERTAAWSWAVQFVPLLLGTPYLWGGKTPWGYDCSGWTQTLYHLTNVALPRDADQQYAAGQAVPMNELACGDLLFFDTDTPPDQLPTPPTRVTHVVFMLDRTTFVHASRRYGGVVYGSLDPQSPHFVPTYERRVIGARRYVAQ